MKLKVGPNKGIEKKVEEFQTWVEEKASTKQGGQNRANQIGYQKSTGNQKDAYMGDRILKSVKSSQQTSRKEDTCGKIERERMSIEKEPVDLFIRSWSVCDEDQYIL